MAYFPITIFFSSIFLIASQFGASQALTTSCITNYTETVNNQTHLIDDPYRTNLQALFADLTTSTSTFYNTTAGESPNKAYGLYLCRGDTTTDTCRSCVASLTADLSMTQSGCKEGTAFLDDCMIHYANYSFFGKANDMVLGVQVGKFDRPSQQYNQTLKMVLQDVITNASSSTTLYATLTGAVSGQETVYALAQCTPDISRSSCTGCLKTAQAYLQANITGVAKSAWPFLPSCQLRYDNASFYGVSPANSNAAPPTTVLVATLILFFVNWLI